MKNSSEPYTYEPHKFQAKICHWLYCTNCGLVALKNALSGWCIQKGCNAELHPQYKSIVKAYTAYER